MTEYNLFEKYALLLIKTGVNLQKDQILIVEAPVYCFEFVRIVNKIAFEQGAKDVIVHFVDPANQKDRAKSLAVEDIEMVLPWQHESFEHYLKDGAASLLITSPDPFLMTDLDEVKANALQNYTNTLRNVIRSSIGSRKNRWCIAAVPNKEWAKAIMPDVDEDIVLEKYWDLLFKLVHVDDETCPIENWKQKLALRAKRTKKLDDLNIDKMRFTSSNGTDITFGFVDGYSWGSRSLKNPNKIAYAPNIPTEEICTSPDKYRTNGRVVSTKPLVLGGKIVKDFILDFKDGKVVNVEAKEGLELLKNIINTDEGSCYLGEVALVSYDSPISQSGLVFYNTLIDENASCHIALGRGFPNTLDISATNLKEWEEHNLNYSNIHIDFMIGAEDTRIVGFDIEDNEILIFDKGNYVI